jgi:hypothetical protein
MSDEEYKRMVEGREKVGGGTLPALPGSGTEFRVMPIDCGGRPCGTVTYENDAPGMKDQTLDFIFAKQSPLRYLLGQVLPEDAQLAMAMAGGGKTGRKLNADRAQSAQDQLAQAKENLANLNKQNPRPEGFQKALQQAKDLVKHWAKKAAQKSEEHARVNQR